MSIYRKSVSIIMATTAAALLWGATAGEAAMPVPQRTPKQNALRDKAAPKPAAKAAQKANAKAAKKKAADKKATAEASDEKTLPAQDVDEGAPLPPYPPGARVGTGEMRTHVVGEEDTFVDIARHFGLGYVELRAANPDIDPWAPPPGEVLVIPTFKLLPRARQDGIVVNLGEMRLYYFRGAGTAPLSFPLGIGREGLETPTGETTIIRKVAGPTWYPTARMREEKTWLPAAVPAGNANPLGSHAMYLGFPQVLIHGSNKPWGIGRRVSSGCMRMYPEDITTMFSITPIGTHVSVVNQPVKVGWVGKSLYLEANPSMTQSNQIEIEGTHDVKPMSDGLKQNIIAAAGDAADLIDWQTVQRVVRERRGYPVMIASRAQKQSDASGSRDKSDYN